jgi:hypothetical protein
MKNRKHIDLRIEYYDTADLKDLLSLLRKIQWCGEVGAGRKIPLTVDGDGSGRYDFHIHQKDITNSQIKNIRDIVILNPEYMKEVEDGEDFKPHYIGE